MTAKKCRQCGKSNPRFFTHCVDCGSPLADDTRKPDRIPAWLKYGLILSATVLLVFFVILPVVQYSHAFGQDLSDSVSAKNTAESITEYPVNQSVENGGLRITVSSAKNGENTYNANRFYIVAVYLQNMRVRENIQISSVDFELVDADGMTYYPYGIGSKVMYDLSPSEGRAAELTYIIPQ